MTDRSSAAGRMEDLMQRLIGRKGVRHVILGASSLDGEFEWSGAVGDADPTGTPVGPETPWMLASVTKLYIAAVILRLHEMGLVDLEVPIVGYLPTELAAGLHVLDGVDRTELITLTHLLGHMTGLPDCLIEHRPGERSLIDEAVEEGDRSWTFEEVIARGRDRLRPHFPPADLSGERPKIRYSDTNFQLLMVIAERVTGKAMSRIYRDLLFEPLGLHRTWLPGTEPIELGPAPAAVWLGETAVTDRPLMLSSIADLYGTVEDVLRFGRALFGGEVFEKPDTLGRMWARFNRFGFPRGLASLQSPSWPIEYGLGLMRFELSRPLAGGRRIPSLMGHTGSTGSWLWYSAESGLLTAGTVDQATAAAIPFRQVAKALAGLARDGVVEP